MAFATAFDEENGYLNPPPGVSLDEVEVLSVRHAVGAHDLPVVISCWRLSKAELEEVNRTGRIWLGILGQTMPPAWVDGLRPMELDR